jgi:hypothetical protein
VVGLAVADAADGCGRLLARLSQDRSRFPRFFGCSSVWWQTRHTQLHKKGLERKRIWIEKEKGLGPGNEGLPSAASAAQCAIPERLGCKAHRRVMALGHAILVVKET